MVEADPGLVGDEPDLAEPQYGHVVITTFFSCSSSDHVAIRLMSPHLSSVSRDEGVGSVVASHKVPELEGVAQPGWKS